MMANIYDNLRVHFLKLRQSGKTYSEIQKILGVSMPKGTLSYWSRNIKLTSAQNDRISMINRQNLQKGRIIGHKVRREKHRQNILNLHKNNEHLMKILNKDVQRIILSILYLGEGTKYYNHSGLVLGNSDPNVIRLYINLLKSCYGIEPDQLRCRITYRADQSIKQLEKFWSQLTGIKHFYKTIPDPRTLGKRTRKKDYKGVCVIHCLKSTQIQLELETISKMIALGL